MNLKIGIKHRMATFKNENFLFEKILEQIGVFPGNSIENSRDNFNLFVPRIKVANRGHFSSKNSTYKKTTLLVNTRPTLMILKRQKKSHKQVFITRKGCDLLSFINF